MNYITLSSLLVGFNNQTTEIVKTVTDREMYLLKGELEKDKEPCTCPHCNSKMHIHNFREQARMTMNGELEALIRTE